MKKAIFGVLALLLVGLVASTGIAYACGGFGLGGPGGLDEGALDEDARAAIEANDYSAWKEAIQNQLTEERFNQLVEQYYERAQFREQDDSARDALIAGDYDAWVEAVGDKFGEVISEEDFEILVQIHEARMEKDFETVSELTDQLDFDYPMFGERMHDGQGFGSLGMEGKMHRMH